jgi:hypothetical protein
MAVFSNFGRSRRGCFLSWVVWCIRTKIYAPARSIGSARRSCVAIVGLGSVGGYRGKLSDGVRVGCNTDSPPSNKSQQLKSCFPAGTKGAKVPIGHSLPPDLFSMPRFGYEWRARAQRQEFPRPMNEDVSRRLGFPETSRTAKCIPNQRGIFALNGNTLLRGGKKPRFLPQETLPKGSSVARVNALRSWRGAPAERDSARHS